MMTPIRQARQNVADVLSAMAPQEQQNVGRLMKELKAIAGTHGDEGRIALLILGLDEIIEAVES